METEIPARRKSRAIIRISALDRSINRPASSASGFMSAGGSTGVIRDVSPRDEVYTGGDEHYFGVGRSSLACIEYALQAAQLPAEGVRRILVLPCGHGRVLRYLKAGFC